MDTGEKAAADALRALATEAKGRAEKATPGPWEKWTGNSEVMRGPSTENTPGAYGGGCSICRCEPDDLEPDEVDDEDDSPDAEEAREEEAMANAVFIAHARQDVPALADATLALLDRVAALEVALGEALDGWEETISHKPRCLVLKHGDAEDIARLRAVLGDGL